MSKVKVNISEFKRTIARMASAIEKTKLNPKSGWLEMEVVSDDKMTLKASNYDYYLESSVTVVANGGDKLHATVSADTFIPLISKLEDEFIEMDEKMNALILNTESSEYTFPIIKELGKVRSVDSIVFNPTRCERYVMKGSDLASIAESNAKGLVGCEFTKEVQPFIYVDNDGALTYTENIYINSFENPSEIGDDSPKFKFLLNFTQAKLLNLFGIFGDVEVAVESTDDYSSSFKVQFTNKPSEEVKLVFIVQSHAFTDKFPALKIRNLASAVSQTHAVIDKKKFEKALARLMVFDKKWDISVLNYSKLVFEENQVRLVSIKNQNYEVVPYKTHSNTVNHESIIRFEDLTNQIKAIMSDEIDVSYGDSRAIVINSGRLKQLIPEIYERA